MIESLLVIMAIITPVLLMSFLIRAVIFFRAQREANRQIIRLLTDISRKLG